MPTRRTFKSKRKQLFRKKCTTKRMSKGITLRRKFRRSKPTRSTVQRIGGGGAPPNSRYRVFAYTTYAGRVEKVCQEHSRRFTYYKSLWDKFDDQTDNIILWSRYRGTDDSNKLIERAISGQHCLFFADFSNPQSILSQFHALISICEFGIQSLTIIVPYFPTGTMERIVCQGEVATAHTLSHLLSSLPQTVSPVRIMTYDLHTLQNRFYVSGNAFLSLHTAIPLLRKWITKHTVGQQVCIVFPDDGAHKRYKNMFSEDTCIICDKVREEGDKRRVIIKQGFDTEITESNYFIIVDDLTQSGSTIFECGNAICQSKLDSDLHLAAFVTHGIFQGGKLEKVTTNFKKKLKNSKFHPPFNFIMTDTCTETVDACNKSDKLDDISYTVLPLMEQMITDLDYSSVKAKNQTAVSADERTDPNNRILPNMGMGYLTLP